MAEQNIGIFIPMVEGKVLINKDSHQTEIMVFLAERICPLDLLFQLKTVAVQVVVEYFCSRHKFLMTLKDL